MSEERLGDPLAPPTPSEQVPNRDDNPSPFPLEYAAPPKRNASFDSVAVAGGALLSMTVVAFLSTNVYLMQRIAQVGPRPRSWRWIIAYLALGVGSIIVTVVLWRRRPFRYWSKWFLLGMMIGLGIIGLLEGVCWFAT